jgi:hypothetical protein
MDAAAVPNGNEPRRDIHGIAPEIETELASANYPGNHRSGMQAASELPTGRPEASRLYHVKGAGSRGHDRVRMRQEKITSGQERVPDRLDLL